MIAIFVTAVVVALGIGMFVAWMLRLDREEREYAHRQAGRDGHLAHTDRPSDTSTSAKRPNAGQLMHPVPPRRAMKNPLDPQE